MLYFNTNKPHSFFFFCRIPVVLENRRSSQKGGRGAHPLHPPPRSAPVLVACGMELPSFMQLSGNNLFQGFRYKGGVARNREKERGREKGTLLPATCPQTSPPPPLRCFFFPTDTLFFVLSPLSECLEQATWRWLFKKNGFCTLCCAVYKSLSKGQKIGFRYCSSAPVFKSQVILENLLPLSYQQ